MLSSFFLRTPLRGSLDTLRGPRLVSATSLLNTSVRNYISSGQPHNATSKLLGTQVRFASRYRTAKEEEEANRKLEEDMKSDDWIVRWGAKFRSEKFQKGMLKYMLLAYGIFLIYGYFYMQRLYTKETELKSLEEKQKLGKCSEYETLRIKELHGKLRTRDTLKLEAYRKLLEEGKTVEDFEGLTLPSQDQNKLNKSIVPPLDTTSFYEEKAAEYDKDINFEERMIRMGKRRKWLMRHCKGDVLEVACGTGRNIKYLRMEDINSITFLDSSKHMMEITHDKFRKKFPKYTRAAFVVGRAEDLKDLAKRNGDDEGEGEEKGKSRVQYDTIVEAFGLCSHEDPVSALKNFSDLLKPDGRIVLLEHGRGRYKFINKILDKRAKLRMKTWGCRWNLDIGEILDDSGLEIVEEKRTHMGTTWLIVAKKKGGIRREEEVGFIEKYISGGIKEKMKAIDETSSPESRDN